MAASNTIGAVMAIGAVLAAVEALRLIRSSGTSAAGAQAGGRLTGTHAPFGQGTPVGEALTRAMQEVGVDSSHFDAFMQLIAREDASGDPNATNPVAVAGQHATGPAQFLPSTFAQVRARHNLGPGDIHNIHDAYVTMIYCVLDAYGAPEKIPGLYAADYPGYHC